MQQYTGVPPDLEKFVLRGTSVRPLLLHFLCVSPRALYRYSVIPFGSSTIFPKINRIWLLEGYNGVFNIQEIRPEPNSVKLW
ncbi:hypothetical protein JTB14_018446 [Gonioctena quinquepunctata]|nr:hypothetical protein JTB14_018446 [Gonioctena quinquepunctata]